jgi:lipopolysaccharide export system ATP-binding protein
MLLIAEHVCGSQDPAEAPRGLQGPGNRAAGKLALISVCKAFGNRPVLRDLSLEVSGGEVVGLFGADGAGKTVCFYTILGLTKPERGRIELNGVDISKLPTYRRALLGLGYLPQESSLFRGLSVEQNLAAILEMNEPDRSARSERLERILKDFDLERLRRRKPPTLSGGERRRVEVARALASDPDIMLLDEPFAGIDPLSIAEIKRTILQLKDRGIGVLITDYDVHDMVEVIDRAYVIQDGSVIFAGPPSALTEDPAVRRYFLGDTYKP